MKPFTMPLALALACAGGVSQPGAQGTPPAVGDPAPAFELPGSDGSTHSLADYEGTPIVLAWFPKAFTGG